MAFYRDFALGLVVWFLVSLILGAISGGDGPWVSIWVFIALSVPWSVWVAYHHREFLRQSGRETRERQQRIERALGLGNAPKVREAWVAFRQELCRPITALAAWYSSVVAETQRRGYEGKVRRLRAKKRHYGAWASRVSRWLASLKEAADQPRAQSAQKRERQATRHRQQESGAAGPLREHRATVDRLLHEPRQTPAYLTDWQTPLMHQIQDLHPTAFELLTRDLLLAAGLADVTVVGGSGDGGIDGIGQLRVLHKAFPVYFQCKRYRGSVGPSEVRDFRGAMDGRTGQGLLITTGTFTKAARQEADRRGGAKPIDLVDGENLMNLMREHRLGLVLDDERDRVLRIDNDYFHRLTR